MPRFTVRVELHGADTWAHYEKLYESMAHQGFTDTLVTEQGRVKMPPAEYNYEGTATRAEVLAKAQVAAGRVVTSYAVLVTESAGRTWSGLEKA